MQTPLDTKMFLRSAHQAEAAGKLLQAEQFCARVLESEPENAEALLLAGSLAARANRNDEAVALLRRAVAADPGSYDGLRWLAGLLIGRAGGLEAVNLTRRAVEVRSDDPSAHVLLGMASLTTGMDREAIEAFKKAVELAPEMAGAYHNLGVALQRDERDEEALEAFKRAIKLSPGLLPARLHLGTLLLSMGDGDSALRCAEDALKVAPTSRGAARLRSDSALAAIRGKNGERHIRLMIKRAPGEGFPYALLGGRLQEEGKFEEAGAALRRSIELQPVQGFAYFLLAHNRRFKEADRPSLDEWLGVTQRPNLHPEDRRYLWFALGKAYDDLGQYESAIKFFDLANGEDAEPIDQASERQSAARMRDYKRVFPEEPTRLSLPNSPRPIFIFGMPRSGTTLIEQILSRHSQVGAAGELTFWRDHRRRIVDLETGTINRAEAERFGQKYCQLLASFAPGKPFVADKMPGNYVHLGLLRYVFPDAPFIHARRHPLDTCLSTYMRPFVKVRDFGRSRRSIVDSHLLHREVIGHWREVMPGRILDLDYERVATDPENSIRELVAYCGLDWEEACLSPEAGERRVLTYSNWQVRQPVYTSSVERWRNYEPWLGVFKELVDEG